jgi:hypothetical protein
MLKHMGKTGDDLRIMTTDDVPEAPSQFNNFPIYYTPGSRFPLYKHIVLSWDIKLVAYNFLKVRSEA